MGVPSKTEEWYRYSPLSDLTLQQFSEIMKAVALTLHDENIFLSLSEETRKHFIVTKRNGESYRYGNKPKERKPLNPRPEA